MQAYAAEQHPSSADAAAFVDHYASNGWRVSGNTQMVDWRAACRNWMRRRPQFQTARPGGPLLAPPAPALPPNLPTPPAEADN